MLPVSTTKVNLKLRPAANMEKLKEQETFKKLYDRCSNMINSYLNSFHVLVEIPDYNQEPVAVYRPKQAEPDLIPTNVPDVIQDEKSLEKKKSIEKKKPTPEDVLFDEIDDIYVYVREGGTPPKLKSEMKPSTPPQSTGDHYWEEPDYETLAKYNAAKKKEEVKVAVPINIHRQTSSGSSGESRPFIETKMTTGGVVLLGMDKKVEAPPPPLPPKHAKLQKSKSCSPQILAGKLSKAGFVKKSSSPVSPNQKIVLVPPTEAHKREGHRLSKEMRSGSHGSLTDHHAGKLVLRATRVTSSHEHHAQQVFKLQRPGEKMINIRKKIQSMYL